MFTIFAKVSWRNLLMFREKKRRIVGKTTTNCTTSYTKLKRPLFRSQNWELAIYASLYSQGTLKRFFFEWVREGIVFSLVAHVSSVAKPGSDQRKKIHFTLTYITRQCTMYLGLLPCKNNQVIFFSHQILSTTLHCGKCLWHF